MDEAARDIIGGDNALSAIAVCRSGRREAAMVNGGARPIENQRRDLVVTVTVGQSPIS